MYEKTQFSQEKTKYMQREKMSLRGKRDSSIIEIEKGRFFSH